MTLKKTNYCTACYVIVQDTAVWSQNNLFTTDFTYQERISMLFKQASDFQCKIVNIFLPKIFSICLDAQKNRLIETVLLSTHNICFG